MIHSDITSEIIRIFYRVYNKLGYGFLEKVYENAMRIEFERVGLKYENQFPIDVYYDGYVVGHYVADFVVDGKVIVELKAIRELSSKDGNQLLNYLRCTEKSVGLILNYGEKPVFKRRVL